MGQYRVSMKGHLKLSFYLFATLFPRRLAGEENRSGSDEEDVFRNIRCHLFDSSNLQIILQVAIRKRN